MLGKKLRWKHWLFILLAAVLAFSLLAGCGGEAAEDESEEKPLIRFHDGQWESLWIENAIAQYIVENGYGYPTETVVLDTTVMQVSLSKGEIHVDMEMWHQNYEEWFEENIANGNLIKCADILEGGPQFFMIPQWVHEEYGINTIDDMKEHWELFKDPEDYTKGAFINCKIGWQCGAINKVKLKAYGLDEYYNIIDTGSGGAMVAAYTGAMKKHDPVFGYYWAPTALMGMYDWYVLEEPEYDEAVWSDIIAALDDESLRPVAAGCAYESKPLANIIWSGLRDKAPDVVAFLEKYVVGLDRVNKAAAWSLENEISEYEKTAIWFLREYDSLWKTWVTTDAYNKIKNALAEED